MDPLCEALRDGTVTYVQLLPPKKQVEAKTDWAKIKAIAFSIIFGLIATFSVLCFRGDFPTAILGGTYITILIFVISAPLAAFNVKIAFQKIWLKTEVV